MDSFEKLNEYQKRAVLSKDRYALLNASVGSGKTTVLINKILYLTIIEKVPIEKIVVLTFTNKASNEILERLKAFSINVDGNIYFGTFHSVAKKILKDYLDQERDGFSKDFIVIDNDESVKLLEDIINEKSYKIKYRAKLLKRIDEFKIGKPLFGNMKRGDDIEELLISYREEKLNKNLMDFDDLIDKAIDVLKRPINPEWIIIDEFQDTDRKQLELIERIKGDDTKIFAIGDPYQVIYSFRTGNSRIFDEFKSKYMPVEYSLPVNYRSSSTIIEAAKSIIGSFDLKGVKDKGSPIIVRKNYDSFNEALYFARRIREFNLIGVPLNEIAVLYRRRAQGDVIGEVLSRENIPFNNVFKGDLSLEGDAVKSGAVNLMTIHGAKGLEFSHVFIAGVNMGNIPLTSRRNEEEEEARLFFVAITRAKNHLELSYLTKPDLPHVLGYKSPYISMIPKNLIETEETGENKNIKDLMSMFREMRDEKSKDKKDLFIEHPKYGIGKVIFEDENILRADFEGYGEREILKMFSTFKYLE